MYPSSFFSLFPVFPRENKVFVAMSFAPEFQARWEHVIAPGVAAVPRDGSPLEAVRVDIRQVGDSILTEILTGISTYCLVLADVSQIGRLNGKAVRNANVMYEVGLAHAVRLPEEVLLFRSDDDPLLFDLANVRVNRYNPDEQPSEARALVSTSIVWALREVDLRRQLAITRAAEGLDHASFLVLAEAQDERGIPHPVTKTMGHALANVRRERAIERLLEIGAIRARFTKLTPELLDASAGQPDGEVLRYYTTEFGQALFHHVVTQMNFLDPEVQRRLDADAPEGAAHE